MRKGIERGHATKASDQIQTSDVKDFHGQCLQHQGQEASPVVQFSQRRCRFLSCFVLQNLQKQHLGGSDFQSC